jgi:hypothetical protein
MLEEDFNLPTVFVNGRYGAGSQVEVVRQEDQDLSRVRALHFDPSQRIRTFLDGLGTSEFDLFILEHMAELRDSFVPQDFVQSIVFHPGDKIDSLATPSTPEGIVGITPIVNNDGSGRAVPYLRCRSVYKTMKLVFQEVAIKQPSM